MRRSFSSMSTSPERSSKNGTTLIEAKLVWRRACESKGEMRTRRCMPRSEVSSPLAYRPRMMKLADRIPASWPRSPPRPPLEAPSFRPPLVHPHHHLGPVLGVGAAVLGVDLAHRVTLVVLAGEERPQLEGVELGADPEATMASSSASTESSSSSTASS
jgi:hypothetical protein